MGGAWGWDVTLKAATAIARTWTTRETCYRGAGRGMGIQLSPSVRVCP